jgi:lysophospholipase L1-like esterase
MKYIFAFLFVFVVLNSIAQKNRFESEIRSFEKKDSLNKPESGQILLYGSSTIRFWGSSKVDLDGYPTINRGFGGSQTEDAIHFFDRMVVTYQPKLILFYEGDNDLAAGKSVEAVFADYVTFMNLIKEKCPNTQVAIYTLRPSLLRVASMPDQRKLNDLYRKYCKKHKKKAHLIDAYADLLDANGQPNINFLVSDKLHLNAEGYKIWTKVTRAFLENWRKKNPL